jgi:hypothetical protein
MGVVAGYMGLRVWRGRVINPRNTVEAENKFAVLSVAVLPISIVFIAWALLGLASEAGATPHGIVVRSALLVIEVACTLVSLIAAAFSISLFFLWKPRRFVPPHLRDRQRGRGRYR